VVPKIIELLELSKQTKWLVNPTDKADILKEALENGLLLGKELASSVERYLMALYRQEMVDLIEGRSEALNLSIKSDPIFRGMLQYDVLGNHLFEWVLVALRKELSAQFVTNGEFDFDLVCDLALHFHFTGFISGIQKAEVETLKHLISGHLTNPSPKSYAVLSMYEVPVLSDELLIKGSPLVKFKKLVDEHLEMKSFQMGNGSVTYSDAISKQYTEHPYPLWRQPKVFMSILQLRRVQVEENSTSVPRRRLVAGCGTGRQPLISLTRNFERPERIDAIDVSPTSIAYAKRRLVDFSYWIGLHLADIIEWCQERPGIYDSVECIGVLHHTRNDREYLESLIFATKPGGKITLGLYSEVGRRDILEARAVARTMEHDKDLRLLRTKIINTDLEHKERLMSRRDFYTRAEFKDLVANNREKNYCPQDILKLLSGLPVRISWFQGVNNEALGDSNTLDLVEKIEAKNNSAYSGMYVFTLEVLGGG